MAGAVLSAGFKKSHALDQPCAIRVHGRRVWVLVFTIFARLLLYLASTDREAVEVTRVKEAMVDEQGNPVSIPRG